MPAPPRTRRPGEGAPRPRAEGADDAGGLAAGRGAGAGAAEEDSGDGRLRRGGGEVVPGDGAQPPGADERGAARLHAGDEVAGDRQPEGPRLEGGRDVLSYLRDHRAEAYGPAAFAPIVGMTTAETDKPFKASESIGGNAVR